MFALFKAKSVEDLRAKLLAEPWARIALAIGIDPVDVEGQGRHILRLIAETGVDIKNKEVGEAGD